MRGPGVYARGGHIPAAAASWPTQIVTTQYTTDDGRLVRPPYGRRYTPSRGAEVWVAWTLTPPTWRDGADELVGDAQHYQARGVVLNCEAGWERVGNDEARAMVEWFQARGLRVAICSYPWPRQHPRLPWTGWGSADVGLAETYNRDQNYPPGRVEDCVAEWRAHGFRDGVLSMVGAFARDDQGTREKTGAELRADLAERPAASSVVWGPPRWGAVLSRELSRWGGGAPRPPSGAGVVLALLAAGAAVVWAARG